MSRVGKRVILIPKDVTIDISGNKISVKGKYGLLEREVDNDIVTFNLENDQLAIICIQTSKKANAYHGLMRALIQNMVTGVSEQFTKTLIAQGVGYKFQIENKQLVVNAGYSHPVNVEIPEGLTMKTESPTRLLITGIDKEKVGFIAAKVHDIRPPEPYKGKGLMYEGEKIIRKAGKTGK
mgnify:CR=1 FL=1|jgi:large subunit ribosomal protein L6|tara:strand:+ start:367 stop:906 length:540 start_codon:yes stop_codon:yes gene_type:complete